MPLDLSVEKSQNSNPNTLTDTKPMELECVEEKALAPQAAPQFQFLDTVNKIIIIEVSGYFVVGQVE